MNGKGSNHLGIDRTDQAVTPRIHADDKGTLTTRRSLLALAATAPAAMVARSAIAEQSDEFAGAFGDLGNDRRSRALQVRIQTAIAQRRRRVGRAETNGDEQALPSLVGNYSKGLPHDSLGEVDRSAYGALLRAVTSADFADFEAIPLGGTAKLVTPMAAFAFQLEGADSHALRIRACPSFSSEEQAGELAELYWAALTRDVPFSLYGVDPLTTAAVADLRRFARFSDVTPATLFRGETKGDRVGPYLSQFLWLNVPFGATAISQKYRTTLAGDDHLVDYQDWLAIQNGNPPTTVNQFDATARYIRNGRDLGEWDQRDFTYQAFVCAALILLSFGPTAFDETSPYRSSRTQGGFVIFGANDTLAIVAKAADCALKAAWYQKWPLHRRARPEAVAGCVHNHLLGRRRYPINSELLSSPALSRTFELFGSYLLPQAYPQGSPLHPSYPAGHATIGGACVTVLKALFDESRPIPAPKVAADDGLTLLDYTGEPLTVGGELDKLAANVALGRDTAGIHWRSDGIEGLRLGEKVALSILRDLKNTCVDYSAGFRLTLFDGSSVTI